MNLGNNKIKKIKLMKINFKNFNKLLMKKIAQ